MEDAPRAYESNIVSEYGKWNRRANLAIQLLVLAAILFAITRIEALYAGNPNGGGRQVVCAIAKDDAAKDAEVAKIVHANCPDIP